MKKQNPILFRLNPIISSTYTKFFSDRFKAFPRIVSIELTNKCNLRCSMCPKKIMTRVEGFITDVVFEKIIEGVCEINGDEMNISTFDFSYFGEALLHKKFFEYASYAKDNLGGVTLSASTNGMLLTEENISKVLNSDLDYLTISFDGSSKRTYEKMRCGGDFTEVSQNIRNLLREKSRLEGIGPRIVIQVLRTPENEKEIPSFKRRWEFAGKIEGVSFFFKEVTDWGRQFEGIETFKKRGGSLFVTLPCTRPLDMIPITWEGEVLVCCWDYDAISSLGNVKEDKLSEIWNNEKAKKYKDLMKTNNYGKIPLCKNCSNPRIHLNEIISRKNIKKILKRGKRKTY
ncbi:MAG: radical SAM protein [Methanobacteriota archaeon]